MKEHVHDLSFDVEKTYWWYVARRAIVLDQVARILNRRTEPGRPRLLDFGCGTGQTLLELSALGETCGLDRSERAVAYCRRRGLSNTLVHDPERQGETNPFDRPFDLILMLDVLEHVADEVETLRMLRSWLRPTAAGLLLSVPAYEFLWSGEDYVSNHLRRYSRQGVRRVLEAAGFKVQRATYFNTVLFPLQVGTVLARRLLRPRSMYTTVVQTLPPAVNDLLRWSMGRELPLLRHLDLPFGGSILAWAQPLP